MSTAPVPDKNLVPIGRQISVLLRLLNATTGSKTDPMFKEIRTYVDKIPEVERPPELYAALKRSFGLSDSDLRELFQRPIKRADDFESLVPTGGWLNDYIQYTRLTEPPTVFHFFVGLATLGSALGRNVSFNLGFGHVFPNMCVILVAPSGKCRKTSCCELGVKLYRAVGGNVLADKITPEALVNVFQDAPSATGLIYAGELAQFLGKQKYMEGMIPLLTRLFDCPDVWSTATIARKELTLKNVAFSMLGASTMDWLRTGIPTDSFGGGFMSRFLFVVQEDTPRSFPIPPTMREDLKVKLVKRLIDLTHLRGNFQITPAARSWYETWYNSQSLRSTEGKQFAGYFERKPAHLFRLSMLLTLAVDDSLVLEKKTLQHALAILDWAESWLPAAFEQLTQTSVGEDHTRLIGQLKRHGGELGHSDWLRRNSSRLNARQFKDLVSTLREAKLVDFDHGKKVYYLTSEGWQHG